MNYAPVVESIPRPVDHTAVHHYTCELGMPCDKYYRDLVVPCKKPGDQRYTLRHIAFNEFVTSELLYGRPIAL